MQSYRFQTFSMNIKDLFEHADIDFVLDRNRISKSINVNMVDITQSNN